MDIYVLSQKFETLDVLDVYKSLIWSDRYFRCGDFELTVTPTKENVELLQFNRYLWREDSEHLMVIENIQQTTDTQSGYGVIVTGRSLESILDRRIIWEQTRYRGNLQQQVKKMLEDNAINPTDPKRKIENLIFEETTDPAVTALEIDKQYTGDNLYDVIVEICELNSIGFKITFRQTDGKMVFKLYAGADRSYAQFANPYVVFSPGNENLISSNHITYDSDLKTFALIAGEDSGENRVTTTVGDETVIGINRRELYVDARDLQTENEDGTTISSTEYLENLKNRGKEKMAEYKIVDSFEGEVSPVFGYIYDKDYFLGDIFEIETPEVFNIQRRVRVIEYVRSLSDSDYNAYPTFEVVEDKEA